MKLIEAHDNGVKVSELILRFGCRKTLVYDTIKKKDEILSEWLAGKSSGLRKRKRCAVNEDINDTVFKWFQKARAKSVPLSGPLIQAQALSVAEKLGKSEFKASK